MSGLFGPDTPQFWIPPSEADDSGIVGAGGNLAPATMLRAYSEGVFAWFNEGDPILWWSPDPRAIFEIDQLNISRRLARTYRSGKFHITINQAFSDVVAGCANRDEGTWITESMIEAYQRLHRLGHAHSLETWLHGQLVGGIYGVSIGGLFAGESMFHRATDASKVALVALMEHLVIRGYELFDTQMVTTHTSSMGAIEIPRANYLARLTRAIQRDDVSFV